MMLTIPSCHSNHLAKPAFLSHIDMAWMKSEEVPPIADLPRESISFSFDI